METQAVIQAVIDAANRNDMDGLVAHVHDDFLGVIPPDMSAEPDTYSGKAGVRRYFELWYEIADSLVITIDHFEQVRDWTVAVGQANGTGRGSGLPFEQTVAVATLMRDGLMFRVETFPGADEARAKLESG